MTSEISESATVPQESSGCRFDQVAAELFPNYSRSKIKSWIIDGALTLDGRIVKPNTKLAGGESLELSAVVEEQGDWVAEDIPIDVVYQDAEIIVINKQPGLVVHPAAGNWQGTLLNGLLYHFPELVTVPRAGIVHRLDKDTSGLMVVARTIEAQNQLVKQLQNKTVKRQYMALGRNLGNIPKIGHVDQPIGRHPTHRTKMAVVSGGKSAKTNYRIIANHDNYAVLELNLETGRTHQIRVHMAYINCPLVGDPVYGKPYSHIDRSRCPELVPLHEFPRQALHAQKLGLLHPSQGEYCEWECDLPSDLQSLLECLESVA